MEKIVLVFTLIATPYYGLSILLSISCYHFSIRLVRLSSHGEPSLGGQWRAPQVLFIFQGHNIVVPVLAYQGRCMEV